MLNRLERAIDRFVDGSLAGVFRLRVQPAEIGRRLERAMLEGRTTSVGKTIVPNAFVVNLHPEDAAAFADWEAALCRELEDWLAELAYARGVSTVAAIRVRLVADPAVRRRTVRVVARVDADSRPSRPTVGAHARLRLISAEPGSPDLTVDTGGAAIGRDATSDLVVAAAEVSRRHARITWDGTAWQVHDLGSTNGTWLNGERISRSIIQPGDELAFGRARYTVARE